MELRNLGSTVESTETTHFSVVDAAGNTVGVTYQGDAETIYVDPATKIRHGAADPRKRDTQALGY